MSGKYLTKAILSFILISLVVLTACSNASASSPSGGAPNVPATSGGGSSGAVSAPNPAAALPKNPGGRIKATWITPVNTGDTVTFPVSELNKNFIIHFAVDSPSGKMPFMAYLFQGKTHIRADICPPCRSYNFSLDGDILVCDTCGSRFKAGTGDGVSGACVNYPKTAVAWVNSGDNIVVKNEDLKAAYLDTLKPG